jgi:hypothetical protein
MGAGSDACPFSLRDCGPSRARGFDAILPAVPARDRIGDGAGHEEEVCMALIRHRKDFYAGVMFMAFGMGAIVIGSNYALGTAARMGPGYFPRILGVLLIVLGALLALRSVRGPAAAMPRLKWRPTAIVLGSVVGFGLIIEKTGLFVSTVLLIFFASTASHEFRWKEALASGVFFALLAIAVFVLGLKIQLPVWPTFLSGTL